LRNPRPFKNRLWTERLISEVEFVQCTASLEHHLAAPEALVVSHVFIQAWGRNRKTIALAALLPLIDGLPRSSEALDIFGGPNTPDILTT
jgi:hypothetical protein